MTHFTARVRIEEKDIEHLQALIDETAHVGVVVRDHSLKPLPGDEPLAAGKAELTAWYEDEADALALIDWVKAEIAACETALIPVEAQDWAEGWKACVRATRAGRFWVGPSWLREEAGEDAVALVIDPGMAFGTGDHPTTAMCLEAIGEWVSERPGCSVLDVGTGTGVLVMAAKKIGAGEAVANDIDPQAVEIARENAALNGVEGVEWTTKPLERIRGAFDLVLANIFANVLCHLAPRLCDATASGGRLMLTGILDEQAAEVLAAFEREGMCLVRRREEGEWVLLEMARAPDA